MRFIALPFAVLFLTIACSPNKSAEPLGLEDRLLSLVVEQVISGKNLSNDSKEFYVVETITHPPMLESGDEKWGTRIWQTIKGVDVDGMIKNLGKLNKTNRTISGIKDGKRFILDRDGRFNAYFKTGGGGWERLRVDNPNCLGMLHLSRPYFDPIQQQLIVYVGESNNWLAGIGGLYFFSVEGDNLRQIDWIGLWVS